MVFASGKNKVQLSTTLGKNTPEVQFVPRTGISATKRHSKWKRDTSSERELEKQDEPTELANHGNQIDELASPEKLPLLEGEKEWGGSHSKRPREQERYPVLVEKVDRRKRSCERVRREWLRQNREW